jgi:hypothetical protein
MSDTVRLQFDAAAAAWKDAVAALAQDPGNSALLKAEAAALKAYRAAAVAVFDGKVDRKRGDALKAWQDRATVVEK